MQIIEQNPVVLCEEDYNYLRSIVERMPDKNDEMSLAQELKRAIVVKKEALPPHCIGIGSFVSVQDLATGKTFSFTIVTPGNADIKRNRISVITPMGAALIGFRKGEEVSWKVPAGLKHFKITEVRNV